MAASRAARITATPASGVMRSNVRHEPSASGLISMPLAPSVRSVAAMSDLLVSDGVHLAVDVSGPDDAPTVVLVHGLAASVDLGWRATGVLDRLGAAGLRVVAYDARGHGRSDKPHEPDHYGDARLMLDLAEIVQGFAGPDAVVAGYSMGSAT